MYTPYECTTNLSIDDSVSIDQALNDLPHSSLTSHVQWWGEVTVGRAGTSGAVDVCAGLDEEAGSGCVVEEDGSVEESEGEAVCVPVPGIWVTAMDDLGEEMERW